MAIYLLVDGTVKLVLVQALRAPAIAVFKCVWGFASHGLRGMLPLYPQR